MSAPIMIVIITI